MNTTLGQKNHCLMLVNLSFEFSAISCFQTLPLVCAVTRDQLHSSNDFILWPSNVSKYRAAARTSHKAHVVCCLEK